MTGIRGAITVSENTREAILEATKELLAEVIAANKLEFNHIIDILFSSTKDLDAANPAAAAREMGIVEAALFGVQEMDITGSLPMCIRILLHSDKEGKQSGVKHVYLRGAKVLRPDLVRDSIRTNVAIDGPSGAGKSTVAKEVAKATGNIYIDTGAMYRAVALYNIRSFRDQDAVESSLGDIDIDIKNQRLFLNGKDVTDDLRTQEVAEGSSVVATYPSVRQKLLTVQRALARRHDVVMDGRDIGTHVLPDARVKIYLDASLEERIKRRMGELQNAGKPADYETIKHEIKIRDDRDINRKHAPLRQAEDSIYINSDGMTVEDITQRILEEIR